MQPVADRRFHAVHFHRRLEGPVRQVRECERFATDADEPLDMIVPRPDVRITNRPVDAEPVSKIGLEIEIAPAIDLSPPDDRLAAYLARAEPVERLVRGSGVGIVDIVRPEPVTQFVEAHRPALDLLPFLDLAAVSQPAKAHVPRRHVLGVIAQRIYVASSLEHECTQPAFAQLLCCPTSGNPGADDDGVVIALNILHCHHSDRE